MPRVAGAVGIPLPPAVGNGMVVELEYNKMVKMGGGRESPKLVTDSTAAHLHPCLSQPARHHSAANAVSSGISTRTHGGVRWYGDGKIDIGMQQPAAVRRTAGIGRDARRASGLGSPYPHGRMGYADTAPRFRCGRDWSEHERSE